MDWTVHSQAEMEQAMHRYFDALPTAQAGSFNAMLDPRFVECSYTDRTIRIALPIQDWMVNPSGTFHGGIGASILDFTMGVLSRICSGGNMTPTLSMTVDYIRAGRPGSTLLVEAECTKCGRQLCYTTAKAWDREVPGKLLLSASATYYTGG